MKTTAILCAVLAGSFGFTSLASADDGRGRRGDDRGDRIEQRQERREARAERRDERRDERREVRRDRQDQRQDRAYRQGFQAGYTQPSYVYSQPSYRTHTPRFHRGAHLPSQYRSHGYYVNNWNAHPGLYAPPHGHQWVQVGSDFLLVAIATGLIANLLAN